MVFWVFVCLCGRITFLIENSFVCFCVCLHVCLFHWEIIKHAYVLHRRTHLRGNRGRMWEGRKKNFKVRPLRRTQERTPEAGERKENCKLGIIRGHVLFASRAWTWRNLAPQPRPTKFLFIVAISRMPTNLIYTHVLACMHTHIYSKQ